VAVAGPGNKKPTTGGQPWVLCANLRSRATKPDGGAVGYNDYQHEGFVGKAIHLTA
jgi:hypothetical protein